MNAGGLYGEARPENFPNVNDYRNPIIAEAMKEMKYVNMFNQGIRRYSGSHERDEVCQYVQPRYKTCAGYVA